MACRYPYRYLVEYSKSAHTYKIKTLKIKPGTCLLFRCADPTHRSLSCLLLSSCQTGPCFRPYINSSGNHGERTHAGSAFLARRGITAWRVQAPNTVRFHNRLSAYFVLRACAERGCQYMDNRPCCCWRLPTPVRSAACAGCGHALKTYFKPVLGKKSFTVSLPHKGSAADLALRSVTDAALLVPSCVRQCAWL